LNYIVPATNNNINAIIYDLNKLAADVLAITGNKKAYREFVRKINISIYNRNTLANILFAQTNPTGYLERIRLETNNYDMFVKITCLGFDYTNEMNDINNNIFPRPSGTSEKVVCDYGIPVWNETTQEREVRNNNRITIINSFRLYGIIGMLTTATTRNYTTVNDVKEIRNQIIDIYETLIENDTTKILIPDIKNDLDKLRDITLKVFANKEQNAYNTISIKLERKYAAQLISYQLYGENIKTETDLNNISAILKGLNTEQPAHAMQGEIEVVQI